MVATRRVARGEAEAMSPTQFPNFQVNKMFEVEAKTYFSANQRNCFKAPILLQILVEYKLVSDLL